MFDFLRSSLLFSIRRLILAFLFTVFILSIDVLFIGFMDIQTSTDFGYETGIHTLGVYGGYTIMALFNKSPTS